MEWSSLAVQDPILLIEQTLQLLQEESPWKTIGSIPAQVASTVMDILQKELDWESISNEKYRAACTKCIRELGKSYDIVPSSFFCQNVQREGSFPVGGGGFADIWKGSIGDTAVCIKVLRLFTTNQMREELLKDCCREALVWKQLRHPNVLPFLGVSNDLFAPSFCLLSPWMKNGNIMTFFEAYPEHKRLDAILEIAEGLNYLHGLDPQIVHADIRGANILVTDDFHYCLADFGLSLVAESQAVPRSSIMGLRGSVRWLPPELMDSQHVLFDIDRLPARDIYSFGCTVIEVLTGKPPFPHIKNDINIIHEVLTLGKKPPRPPVEQFPSDRLWELVSACLSRLPKDRPLARDLLRSLKEMEGICLDCPFSSGVACRCPSPILVPPRRARGPSTTDRPTLTVQTSGLQTPSPKSSSSGNRSWPGVRPRGPREPSSASSPSSANKEENCIPNSAPPSQPHIVISHSEPPQAPEPPRPLTSIPDLTLTPPLVIRKRPMGQAGLRPTKQLKSKAKYKSQSSVSGTMFKQWASIPRDVTVSPSTMVHHQWTPNAQLQWIRADLIGHGPYSQVYKALRTPSGEVMAVKIIEIPATKDQALHERVKHTLTRHCEVIRKLHHANVVKCIDSWLSDGEESFKVFVEYVHGSTLNTLILNAGRAGFGDSNLSKWFLSQIVCGLEYLHVNRVAHRDLKSDSIIVDSATGQCKISGYGLSKRIDDLGARTESPVHGTLFWAAPETMVLSSNGRGDDFKADVWSLGSVACELWAGVKSQTDSRYEELMDEVDEWMKSPVVPPAPEGIVLSIRAEEFRSRCLVMDPDLRATATDLKDHRYLEMDPTWRFDGLMS